jgi:hypothetical protein
MPFSEYEIGPVAHGYRIALAVFRSLSEQASSRASHITLLFDKHNAVMAVLQHDH